MNSTKTLFVISSYFLIANMPLFGQDGFFASSLEKYNYQVGDNQITLRSYDGFDDIDGFDEVTALSLSINGETAANIPYDPNYEAFKRGIKYNTLEEMLADRPIDGSYTHTLTGTPSGSVTITAPNVPYADGVPVNPIFTITGVTGTWGQGNSGQGIFYFNPATTTSFTVSMNAHSANTQGGHYAYGVFLRGSRINGEYSSGLVTNNESPPVPLNLTLTFTKGLDPDAGDEDPTTFGFDEDVRFEIEGEHMNIFGLSDAEIEGDVVGQKAFVYRAVTSFVIMAAASPDHPVARSIEITEISTAANTFTLNWQTDPADAHVDVYRSEDLESWGFPVSRGNHSGSYSEPITPDSKGFFVVVPTDARYPPDP